MLITFILCHSEAKPKNLANEESQCIGIHFATLRSDLSLSKAKE